MKIILSHSVTKRTINGTFQICGSRKDLELIAQQIEAQLTDGFNYGWITIYSDLARILPNESPIQWD